MKKPSFWVLSILITLFFAVFQSMTGPTYPLRIKADVAGKTMSFRLARSCETGKGCLVLKAKGSDDIRGSIFWRRYRTADVWESMGFSCYGGSCGAKIPSQPAAGKVEYYAEINTPSGPVRLGRANAVARFKGAVPGYILIPHIILMFLFMLFSVRIFISAVSGLAPIRHSVPANVAFLLLGGFLFGPLTQYYAFGRAWTGFPFGYDLTDNKTLLMLVFWLIALLATLKARSARFWLVAAFAVTAAVYFVPHSMFGSELDYDTGGVVTGGLR
ncbi:MAG TPA: hypothetical protein DCL44_08880 [Elusimicrobia bacterium]|nr:hypothetical protein [Elusimicrobiota bacterium]